jgi:hypothetical protein
MSGLFGTIGIGDLVCAQDGWYYVVSTADVPNIVVRPEGPDTGERFVLGLDVILAHRQEK